MKANRRVSRHRGRSSLVPTPSGTWPPATPPPYHLLPPGYSCMCPAIATRIAHAKGGYRSGGRGTGARRRSSVVAWSLISGIRFACSLPPIYLPNSLQRVALIPWACLPQCLGMHRVWMGASSKNRSRPRFFPQHRHVIGWAFTRWMVSSDM